jgi:hypothetical protein
MWGRSSDRQHDLTSARFLPSRTIRRSQCPSRRLFSQGPQHHAAVLPGFACTWRNEENRVAPTGVAQPLWPRITGSTVRTSITRRIRWPTPTNSKIR